VLPAPGAATARSDATTQAPAARGASAVTGASRGRARRRAGLRQSIGEASFQRDRAASVIELAMLTREQIEQQAVVRLPVDEMTLPLPADEAEASRTAARCETLCSTVQVFTE